VSKVYRVLRVSQAQESNSLSLESLPFFRGRTQESPLLESCFGVLTKPRNCRNLITAGIENSLWRA
jgi:hypothetical protein